MHWYGIYLYWSTRDNAFIAEVPDFPGCMAHGDTRQSALDHVQQAMDLWIDTARELGHSVPEPRNWPLHTGLRLDLDKASTPRSIPPDSRIGSNLPTDEFGQPSIETLALSPRRRCRGPMNSRREAERDPP